MAIGATAAATEYIEFYNDFGNNHDDAKLHYTHQYHISDSNSQVHILHREQRQGNHVYGSYTHLEPNGHVRSVHYEVRGSRGYRAVIAQRSAHSFVHQSRDFAYEQQRQPLQALPLVKPVAFVI
ncbi:uncharacterized protein Dwil_GK20565 [Drosophila willistoni]|nr:cuticle protein 7 [Drosophila willistoni]EDW79593.2 uncharacterized protein Dwil_GK20565 [Drosophila willistoni]